MSYRERHPEIRQEQDVIPYPRVALALGAILIISAVMVVWAVLAVRAKERELRPSGQFPERELGPRREVQAVQQDLFGDLGLAEILAREQRRELDRYSWVDRDKGVVRVPVDAAMDAVVEEGKR